MTDIEDENSEGRIVIHNKLSPNFRCVHIDGAYGGITPRGSINLNFYAERGAIPKSSTFRIDSENNSFEKIEDSEDSKDGIIREYDFGIYMSLDASKRLIVLLSEKVKELEEILNS